MQHATVCTNTNIHDNELRSFENETEFNSKRSDSCKCEPSVQKVVL